MRLEGGEEVSRPVSQEIKESLPKRQVLKN